ncbi:unnamed protein product [Absidia cylindrospora]
MLGLGSGKLSSSSSEQGGTSVSLLGRRDSQPADDSTEQQQKGASDGGHASVSLVNLRRRGILPGELLSGSGGDGASTAGESGTTVSLIGGLRRRAPEFQDKMVGLGPLIKTTTIMMTKSLKSPARTTKSTTTIPRAIMTMIPTTPMITTTATATTTTTTTTIATAMTIPMAKMVMITKASMIAMTATATATATTAIRNWTVDRRLPYLALPAWHVLVVMFMPETMMKIGILWRIMKI